MIEKIKNITLILLICMMYAMDSCSQSFPKGEKTVNIGIGIGGGIGFPVGISYEQAITDRISVGGYLAYAQEKETYGGIGDWKYTYILAAARGSYHLKVNSDKFDPYGGLMLGYNIASVKWNGSGAEPVSSSAGGVLWGIHIGSKYWFTDKIGAFAELGYGASVLSAGLSFRL